MEDPASQPVHQLIDVRRHTTDLGPADVAGHAGDICGDVWTEAIDLPAADALAGVMVPQVESQLRAFSVAILSPICQSARMILLRVGRFNQSRSRRVPLDGPSVTSA